MTSRARLSAVVGSLSLLVLTVARPALAGHTGSHAGAGHGPMTDAAMRHWAESYWAAHPMVGKVSNAVGVATFTVRNFRFDLDNNAATQVDTAKIFVGESVTWQWIDGFHSITNGTGSQDPSAGSLFDQASDNSHPSFSFAFNSVGTFEFFCRPHEFDIMKGVVLVRSPVGIEPLPGAPLGFTSDPAPNPTSSGVRFTFALREAGRARIEVFDARGRRVAVAMDRDLEAGPHQGTWDGRRSGGAAVGAGVYYLWLRLPGYHASRAVAITR